uniref:Ig-like domain-containing protein n=1 Tax=Varanus komodoensis TaxID=61221 RepID=A0A8D2L663_VARKO
MEAPGVACGRLLAFLLLLLLLLGRWPGAAAQKLEVLQSQGPESVPAGQTLTLPCTLRGDAVPGGVRWHKGSDRQQPPIYSQKEPFPPRVIRVIPESNTDFTIQITDIRPEDAGTYFCVKYRLRVTGESEEASGAGTEVLVIATPSQPVITAPSGRVAPGSTVAFNCSTGGFYPRDITVTWFKGSSEMKASDTVVLPRGENITYQVWSTVKVQLSREDLMTQLLCRITHKTVVGTLEQSFRLADVLRVPPKVQVETSPPSPVKLNTNVTITCHAQGFYPDETSLNLFDVNNKTEMGKTCPSTQNQDGTFSIKSSLELMATEERNMSAFTCLVEHNSQPPLNGTVTLVIKVQAEESGSPNTLPGQCTVAHP